MMPINTEKIPTSNFFHRYVSDWNKQDLYNMFRGQIEIKVLPTLHFFKHRGKFY